jgi:hypothetical protein
MVFLSYFCASLPKNDMEKIAPNKVVAISYELHVDDGESGKTFRESVKPQRAFLFFVWHRTCVAGFGGGY